MLDDVFAPTLRLRLPAALLALWSKDTDWLDEVTYSTALPEGLLPVRRGLLAALPIARDPDVIEAAHTLGTRLAAQAPAGAPPTVLAFPGAVTVGDHVAEPLPSPLLEDLERSRPRLVEGVPHLTGHARHELEGGWSFEDCGNYRAPSGRELPVWQLRATAVRPPWRNPELLGRARGTVARPEMTEALADCAGKAVVLVVGPIGCGKSRLVAQLLGREEPVLWARPWSERSGGAGLTAQLLGQLLRDPQAIEILGAERVRELARASSWRRLRTGPRPDDSEWLEPLTTLIERWPPKARPRLVLDDMHAADAEDHESARRLTDLARSETGCRLVVVGRSGGDWQRDWQELPRVEVGPLRPETMASVCDNLITGLSVPDEVRDRFLAAAAGHPFALEEGLLQLVRQKVLRRVYGNFFFSGTAETRLLPSLRLTRQLHSEAERLGDGTPLRIVTNVDAAIPLDELSGAVSLVTGQAPRGWHEPYVEAGLVSLHDTMGSVSLEVNCPLHGLALESTVAPSSVPPLRHLVGRQLAELPIDPRELWKTYGLLAGTADAVPLLLKVARRSDSGVPREELFIALTEELESHRERQGDERTELEILWVVLPLARRLGRLGQLSSALDRALELTREDPDRRIALTALKAEKEQNEGSYREAEATLLHGLALARDSDEKRKALLVVQLGKVLQRQDRYPEARRLYEEVLPLLDRSGNRNLAATCRFHLGNVALHEKRLEVALQYHQEALKERRQLEINSQIGSSLSALGAICLALGDYPRSLSYYREAEKVLGQHGREGEVSFALIGVGRALSRLGDFTSASQPFRQALALRRDRDDKTGEAIARMLVAENHLYLGQSDLALEETRRAHFQLSLVDNSKQLADAEQLLGRIRLRQRQYEDARHHLETAIAGHQQHGDVLAATFDRAWLLETSIAVSDHRRIEELCSVLGAVLETLRYPELGEALDLRLYQGLEWLRQRGKETDPIQPLLRGYRELYRKTELLSTELRNPFLFQVPDNRAIINAATLHGLSLQPEEES